MMYFKGWVLDDKEMIATAPDGCVTEIDGECPHGFESPIFELI